MTRLFGLFTSWATPETIFPREVIRFAWMSWAWWSFAASSIRMRAVMSRKEPQTISSSSVRTEFARMDTMTGVPSFRRWRA